MNRSITDEGGPGLRCCRVPDRSALCNSANMRAYLALCAEETVAVVPDRTGRAAGHRARVRDEDTERGLHIALQGRQRGSKDNGHGGRKGRRARAEGKARVGP